MLSQRQKKWAQETCIFHSVAINVIKLESCETGFQQLRFAMGAVDDVSFTAEVLNIRNVKELKPLTMADANRYVKQLNMQVL
jgi:hypothetical protein